MEEKPFQSGRHNEKDDQVDASRVTSRVRPDPEAAGSPSVPAITLPKGGGAIRGIGETFSTSASTGTCSLSVPVAVSPGRKGFEQSLQLTYDSGAGNGPFGLGWHLSFAAVTRKTDKGLPRYANGDESDTFVLSGAEDLVPAEVVASGSYSVQRYRPRIETSFVRIERWTDTANGDVQWRTITRENVTSFYGTTVDSRVADHGTPSRVFSWLLAETRDDRGNVVVYSYTSEDGAGVDPSKPSEFGRFGPSNGTLGFLPSAQRFLTRIQYGNMVPVAPGAPAPTDDAGWMFDVVFDYGEYAAPATSDAVTAPDPDAAALTPWTIRQDPFSSHRAGFELRTYRLCRRVLMFHRFSELGGVRSLVRSTDFSYVESPLVTYLGSVTHAGYSRAASSGPYDRATLPALEFTYTSADVHDELSVVQGDSLSGIRSGVEGVSRWVDLDRDGIAGVLIETGHGWFYKRNLGAGQLAPPALLPTLPAAAQLQDGAQQLVDLRADGQLDLVSYGGSLPGFYGRTDEGGWNPFVPFPNLPDIDWRDPNLRFVDLDGDGYPDVLITEHDVLAWYRSLATDGFERRAQTAKPKREDDGPVLVFADGTETIHLADMTGDGLVDLVRVRNGETCYWPNQGYGTFGRKVTLDGSPLFDRPDRFDPRRVRLGDIDGSGTADIIYLGSDGVRLYFNQSGNSLTEPIRLRSLPPVDSVSTVSVIDFLGRGTACLVWSTPDPAYRARPIAYVDVMGGQKPHLLASIDNHLGRTIEITHASSTEFSIADRLAGNPWITRLPFPVQVVSRVETTDSIANTSLVSTYAYHHGYFDGFEREFRGFGMVEQWDAESYSSAHGEGPPPPGLTERGDEFVLPPVHTKSWFDTGAWRQAPDLFRAYRSDWYQLDPTAISLPDPQLPATDSPLEAREAARARKGTLLHLEVYADDGSAAAPHPYKVEEHRAEVVRLQPLANGPHAVFFTHEVEALTLHYERILSDPRVEHVFNLEIDGVGNLLRNAHVAYPRRTSTEPEQRVLLATCAATTFANETDTFYRLGVPIEARLYELTGISAPPPGGLLAFADVDSAMLNAAEIPFEAQPGSGLSQKRLIQHRRTLYLKDDLSAPLALGTIESLVLVYQSYVKQLTAKLVTLVFGSRVTPAMLASDGGYLDLDGDGASWKPSGVPTYDASHFFQVTAMTDAFGNTARVVFDSYALLPVEGHSSDDVTIDNVVLATNDYRVLGPSLVTDPNGNQTAVTVDELGMVVAMAVMGKPGLGQGDTLADPTTKMEYDLLTWQNAQQPPFVHTWAREQHGAANPRWQESYSYSDGSGREVMRKVQAEPDPTTGAARWVGTGRTVFDNKGNPVRKYEPYFAATPNYEDEAAIVMQGVTPILRYDPLGRLIRTDFPNGTFETVEVDAWSETRADANDNVLASAWYATNSSATAPSAMQRAATLAAKHNNTPSVRSVDPLGRTFLTVEDNGTSGKYSTRTALDIQGNQVTVTDARGIAVLHQSFDMGKRLLHSTSTDAGDSYLLPDVADKQVWSWDGRSYAIQTQFDRLRRPSHIYVTAPVAGKILAERIVYGEATAGGGAPSNLRGQKVLHYDGAGELYLSSYDIQGNLTAMARTLAVSYRTTPDFTPLALITDPAAMRSAANPALVGPDSFESSTVYDALNRVMSTTTPEGSVILPTYNEANLVERLDAQLRGAATSTPFVTNIGYNARGQRILAEYANKTKTAYTYDPLTFLLTAQTTTRLTDNADLQDLAITYDPVHNVVEIDENADQTRFFSGSIPVTGGGQYVYDAIYRLVSATGREHPGQQQPNQNDAPLASIPHPNDMQALRAYLETYTYDPVGNIQAMAHQQSLPGGGNAGWTRAYTYAATSNRLQSTSAPGDPAAGPYSATYSYDLNGNMASMPHLATIGWDHLNRMQSADLGGGGTGYYVYDATGTRVRKVIERAGATVDEGIYLGSYEIHRRTTAGALQEEVQTIHVMEEKRRAALVDIETVTGARSVATPTVQMRFQLAGHLDSVLVETDASGAPVSYEEYFPFGVTSFHSSSVGTQAKRYRLSGKERDDETGLYYFGARYYSAWLARWTTTDPIGVRGGIDLYRYCCNNPMNTTDPSGMAPSQNEVRDIASNVVDSIRENAGNALPAEHDVDHLVSVDQLYGDYGKTLTSEDWNRLFRSTPELYAPTSFSLNRSRAAESYLTYRGSINPKIGGISDSMVARVKALATQASQSFDQNVLQLQANKAAGTDLPVGNQDLVSSLGSRTVTTEPGYGTDWTVSPAPETRVPESTFAAKPKASVPTPSPTSAGSATHELQRVAGTVGETLSGALNVLGKVATVTGAVNEANRTATLESANGRGALNTAAAWVGTAAVGVFAGAFDDGLAAMPVGVAPVLESWEQQGAGPFQHAAGEAIRTFLDWTAKRGL